MTPKGLAASATFWSGADVLLRQGVQFFVSVILARILSPSDFGTIALLYLFIGFATVFVDGGFSVAIIKKQDSTLVDESTVFWFNIIIASIAGIVLWLSAPAIARLFSNKILIPLAVIMAINIVVTALGSIHATLLTKRLDFYTHMKVGVIATFASGAIAIYMALNGYGVWALAVQALASSFFATACLWIYSSWRPSFTISGKSLRELFGFGGYLFAAGLLDVAYQRIYTVLIGRYYGTEQLGFYSRADGIKQMPAGVLHGIIGRVVFPMFSAASVSNDSSRLLHMVRTSIRVSMIVNAPVMLGLAAVSQPLVIMLLGEKWIEVVGILQVLCLAGLFWPLHMVNLYALAAQGYSSIYFRIEVLKKIFGVTFIVIGAYFGVMGIAWSQVAFGIFSFAVDTVYTHKYLNYGLIKQLKEVFPIFAISTSAALGAYLVVNQIDASPALLLISAVSTAIGLFIVLAQAFNIAAADDFTKLVKEMIRPNGT